MQLIVNVSLTYASQGSAGVPILLQIVPTSGDDQTIVSSHIDAEGLGPLTPVNGDHDMGQRLWGKAQGEFSLSMDCVVDVKRPSLALDQLEMKNCEPLHQLPASVLRYLFPSRYCGFEGIADFAASTFQQPVAGAKIAAMAHWIGETFTYDITASNASTRAEDTFRARAGVCRDYAHVLIAMARSLSIPARMAAVYAPHVTPQDFHAVAEVWLDGRWCPVDATGMATSDQMVRIVVGRDATDIAFMTAFGNVSMVRQTVAVQEAPGA